MRSLGLVLMVTLAACTEADLLGADALLAVEEPLADSVYRTQALRTGPARLLPDGPVIEEEPYGYVTGPLPVVAIGERLRVQVETPDARLLLWLDREDLGTWVIDGTHGLARPGGEGRDVGIFIDAPVEVEVVDRSGGFVAIAFQTNDWVVDGVWVPALEVGPYWVDRGSVETTRVLADVFLRSRAAILDAPGGDLLASAVSFSPSDPMDDTAFIWAVVHEERDGHLKIETTAEGVTIIGYVAVQDTSRRVEGGRGGSGGCSFGFGLPGLHGGPTVDLPVGTALFVEPDGELVGETLVARAWPVVDEHDGWTRNRVVTPWGSADVWVW